MEETAYKFKGVNGRLILTPKKVIISRDELGVLGKRRKLKDIIINMEDIENVYFKDASTFMNGFLQIVTKDSKNKTKNNVLNAVKDENTIMFSRHHKTFFAKAKKLLEQYLNKDYTDPKTG